MNQFLLVCLVVTSLVCLNPEVQSSPTSPTEDLDLQDELDCPSSCALVFPQIYSTTEISVSSVAQGDSDMASRELNPQYYEASRAGRAIQHYINTVHGSPFRQYAVTKVHKARAEDMGEAGMKYILDFSVKDFVCESSEVQCSAEVLYPRGETHRPPQVQCSCDGLPNLNSTAKEQDFYGRYSVQSNTVSAKDLPDSYGHTDPEMVPFLHLGRLASCFIMFNESTEKTLYGMAQVAKVKQLKSEDDQLRFEYEVLLHDMVSQEIIRWKLQISWSPEKGLKVLESELLPKCHCN
ncbi:latexin [Trichomycterus rosablanca]|uniref:latexin n=1 Tax=Trichomycterus rosablanca TaxID=2290929 RepID=UPI002F355352